MHLTSKYMKIKFMEDFYMRKIGTTTSAICFILLGIWIMINSNNPDLGIKLIKFWPIIIILIGIEILYYTLVKKENERIRISGLVFLIIIVFFFTNISTDIFNNINKIILPLI